MSTTQKDRILAVLQSGPQTNRALNRICFRYGARIHELRAAGHRIETRPAGRGLYEFSLIGGAV